MNLKLIVLLLLWLVLAGCSSFQQSISRGTADITGRPANITCYSGGVEYLRAKSKGKVITEENSDGYVFIIDNGVILREGEYIPLPEGELFEGSGSCSIYYLPNSK